MTDIIGVENNDIKIYNTQNFRAANILSIQLGSLEYEQTLGIDLRYFLSETIEFENESFKAYLVEVLANRGINVSTVTEVIDQLFSTYQFLLSPEETSDGLVAR